RARGLLTKIEFGLSPDTPREIFEWIEEYRAAAPVARHAPIIRLANQGPRGLRVLVNLRRRERDPQMRQELFRAIGSRPHDGAAALLADGDGPAAGEMLETASAESELVARDWAAFLLLRGGLDGQIEALRGDMEKNLNYAAASRLVWLTRARGDLAAARLAAEKAADPRLVDSVLIEQHDWKQLASRYGQRAENSAQTLGFTASFCRLAGDAAGVERVAAAIRYYSDRHDGEHRKCAEALFLNDRPDEAVAILLAQRDYLWAMDFLLPRLQCKEALALADEAREKMKGTERLQIRARGMATLRFTGDHAAALRELRDIADANKVVKDFNTWRVLGEAARLVDEPEEADHCFSEAIALSKGEADLVRLMESAGFSDEFPAAWWWAIMRGPRLSEPYAQTLHRLRSFERGELPPQEVDALVAAAEKSAAMIETPAERFRSLEKVGDTLIYLGRKDSAERMFRKLAELFPWSRPIQRVGDCEAARGDFAAAAATYGRAWDLDRGRAAPLALRGWALLKSGDAREGRACIELAHVLPLAYELERTALEEIFRRHDLPDDARRERELILRTGSFLSWNWCNASRLCGDDANGRGDYAAAADYWELAYLGNLESHNSFTEPWSNVVIPTMIHKTRALGLVKSDPAAALREARVALADSPGDSNTLIELVLAFEKAGNKPSADALYDPTAAWFERLCDSYPDSGPAHNQLAWLEGKCRRNLDGALKHARRAVEIEPRNAASIDTLAEVHFQRGEIDKAIEQMEKCVMLEPTEEQHKKQLERFRAARATH
ncbi:MAG: Tetratricopeptide repeat protein, partial [Phycisphaerales bacterium]|nr:Tetratricopeptide repeat protein [Phycisphaerales bacterium]